MFGEGRAEHPAANDNQVKRNGGRRAREAGRAASIRVNGNKRLIERVADVAPKHVARKISVGCFSGPYIYSDPLTSQLREPLSPIKFSKSCIITGLRRVFFSFWMLCVVGTFLNAPFTHTHVLDDDNHESVVHSHFALHIEDSDSQGSAAIHPNHHGAHYLDLFNAQTESASDSLSFATTQATVFQPAARVLGTAVRSKACAHGPPLLTEIPARSPPTDLLSFLA